MKPNGLALLIVLCMVLTGVAAAEGAQETAFPRWSNGLSAAQPYKELPEVDLTQKLGYMIPSSQRRDRGGWTAHAGDLPAQNRFGPGLRNDSPD